jgi:hypothetical protein
VLAPAASQGRSRDEDLPAHPSWRQPTAAHLQHHKLTKDPGTRPRASLRCPELRHVLYKEPFNQKQDGIPLMTQTKFALKCPQCSSTKFNASTPNPGPDATVACAQCGTSIDLRAEKKRLEEQARAAMEERLRNQR